MSAKNPTYRKKNCSDSTPESDGDHRKRRRNRTTQSCLNCHTSKRMCDRKRPACARCTQLGLTGLCVYEVDDPSQRTEVQDENSRFIKRIAELESIIRELKNKPHPRWSQSHPKEGDESILSSASSPLTSLSSSSSDNGGTSPPPEREGGRSVAPSGQTGFYPLQLTVPQSAFEPPGESSSSLISPLENTRLQDTITTMYELPSASTGVAGQECHQNHSLASMLLNYHPGIAGFNDSAILTMADRIKQTPTDACGCIHEPASYNAMLELSIRLRKASDLLSQSSSHHHGGPCYLHRRISELDSYTINALSDLSTSTMKQGMVGLGAVPLLQPSHIYYPSPQRLPITTEILRVTPSNTRPWGLVPPCANSPTSFDDPFMSWAPPRGS